MLTYKIPTWLLVKSKLTYKRGLSSITKNNWQSVVGLEVHAQLNTKSKLFSSSEHSFGNLVNNSVSLFDAAIPGTLPVLNRKCVELGILSATALACKVNEISSFDRKHYFYADMPSGYQITQQRAPLASDGVINFQVSTPISPKKPYSKSSKIKQIQLEQDSGKSIHDVEQMMSLVDLNRMGAPLIEIVFEPDLEDGEEAAALIKELVLILQTLGACSGKMESGALRVDANVSLRRPGEPLSTRTEIKNIGSVRGVASAIHYEIERQRTVLDAGGRIVNETRSWNAQEKTTVAMRDKEVVQDYRFMPEPNLLPLRVNLKTKVDSHDVISVPLLLEKMPELPGEIRIKLVDKYSIRPDTAKRIIDEQKLLYYFKEIVDNNKWNPSKVANILINDFLHVAYKLKLEVCDCDISVDCMRDLMELYFKNQIDLNVLRDILEIVMVNPKVTPRDVLKEKCWEMVRDEKELSAFCMNVINNNPILVGKYRKRAKPRYFNPLMNNLIKSTNRRLDMSKASRIMKELLEK